jgi:hypothetical protein
LIGGFVYTGKIVTKLGNIIEIVTFFLKKIEFFEFGIDGKDRWIHNLLTFQNEHDVNQKIFKFFTNCFFFINKNFNFRIYFQ